MMRTAIFLVFCVLTYCLLVSAKLHKVKDIFCDDPDCKRNVTELIVARGYPVEEYTVQTKDRYLLGIQRIPHGRGGTRKLSAPGAPKPAVLLQHGLLDAGHTWVIDFPQNSLAYILADAGFDVWLGNARGNVYSRHHTTLDPSGKEFWQFSFDEMAKYDLPDMIDFILSKTGNSQLFYVGHSQGTMMGFGALSNPEIAAKVKLFVALAPVAHLKYIEALVLKIAADLDFDTLFNFFGDGEFGPSNKELQDFLGALCHIDVNICENAMCALMGCDVSNWNNSRWPVYAEHDPAGTSVQNIHHFAQCVRSNNFQMYDYGSPANNMAHYNTTIPPMYSLSGLKVKVAIFSGGNDDLADPIDVAQLLQELPHALVVYNKTIDYYSHLDFIWGIDAFSVIYKDILQLFSSSL